MTGKHYILGSAYAQIPNEIDSIYYTRRKNTLGIGDRKHVIRLSESYKNKINNYLTVPDHYVKDNQQYIRSTDPNTGALSPTNDNNYLFNAVGKQYIKEGNGSFYIFQDNRTIDDNVPNFVPYAIPAFYIFYPRILHRNG